MPASEPFFADRAMHRRPIDDRWLRKKSICSNDDARPESPSFFVYGFHDRFCGSRVFSGRSVLIRGESRRGLVYPGPTILVTPDLVHAMAIAGELLEAAVRAGSVERQPAAVTETFEWARDRVRTALSAPLSPVFAAHTDRPPHATESACTVGSMTSSEAAAELGVTPTRVGQLVKGGDLTETRDERGHLVLDAAEVAALKARRAGAGQ